MIEYINNFFIRNSDELLVAAITGTVGLIVSFLLFLINKHMIGLKFFNKKLNTDLFDIQQKWIKELNYIFVNKA